MKIGIIGCTLSTKRALEYLLSEGHECAVLALEDRLLYKKSRGILLDKICEGKAELNKISNIKNPEAAEILRRYSPDVILEIGWSQIIPKIIIDIPKYGAFGIHLSMLPSNQGAASLNWALINDEKSWGVSLFYLAEKFDAGEIVAQREFLLEDRDNINTLFDKADEKTNEMLRIYLPQIITGTNPKIKQDPNLVSYLPPRKPTDGQIDWNQSGREIYNLVRAITHPYPGAFSYMNGEKVLVWKAKETSISSKYKPGTISSIEESKGIYVATNTKDILLERIQVEPAIESWADAISNLKKWGINQKWQPKK